MKLSGHATARSAAHEYPGPREEVHHQRVGVRQWGAKCPKERLCVVAADLERLLLWISASVVPRFHCGCTTNSKLNCGIASLDFYFCCTNLRLPLFHHGCAIVPTQRSLLCYGWRRCQALVDANFLCLANTSLPAQPHKSIQDHAKRFTIVLVGGLCLGPGHLMLRCGERKFANASAAA